MNEILLPHWLRRCAENHPEHLAVKCGQVSWSFAELDRQAISLAKKLATLGVREGDYVALLASNSLSYCAMVHALTYLGAVFVPLNTRLTVEELCWQVHDVRATMFVSDAGHAGVASHVWERMPELTYATLADEQEEGGVVIRILPMSDVSSAGEGREHRIEGSGRSIEEREYSREGAGRAQGIAPTIRGSGSSREEREHSVEGAGRAQGIAPTIRGSGMSLPESDVSLHIHIDLGATQAILYTSGTTSQPKGVIITYGMQWWNAIGSTLNLGHHADDCWLACMPFFHIGGLSILMRSVIYGISVVVQEKFDPMAVNEAIYEDRVTIISVVAVMLQRMLAALAESQERNSYPSTLRCVLLGGGPAPRALLEDCASRNIPVVQTYGLTEVCSQAVTLAPADALRKLGSAGRPLLPVQLCIMHNGQLAQPNEPGEIHLQGPTVTPGYLHRPDATSAAIQDGWLNTGDIGYLDDEGYLYVLDRRADLIISGGENIYPAEIEAVLLGHPDVEEAAVCGQADKQWEQVPVAFVRLHEGSMATADEVVAYAKQYLAKYKWPRVVYVVKEPLPRNASGKLLRWELRRSLLQKMLS